VPAATPASSHRPAPGIDDTWPAGPWLADESEPVADWLPADPAQEDPEQIAAWLDRELERAAPWLEDDPWLEDYHGLEEPPGPAAPPEVLKAGRWDRATGNGGGFAAGGIADHLPPGHVLAGLAADKWAAGLDRLSDDELIGVLRAARRLASWAAAMELDAVTDLWRRRTAEQEAGDTGAAVHADSELAAALTLTRHAADNLLDLAVALARLPLTRAALATGDIDLPRATVIADELTGLTDAHAAVVEATVIGAAAAQTTGQLRAATHRAVLAADPNAARKRKKEALRQARVERWTEPAGTAAIAGRDLPPAEVLAADANLTALAKQLKAAGAEGTLDILRAKIYLALLTGTPVAALLPANPRSSPNADGSGSPDGDRRGSPDADDGTPDNSPSAATGSGGAGASPSGLLGLGGASITGRVNLTLPLATWLGQSTAPGQVPGFGPLDATDSRALATALAAHPGTKWCLTITSPDGHPVAHGCARAGSSRAKPHSGSSAAARDGPAPGQTLTFTLTSLDSGGCDHAWETLAYRPSAALRHLVNTRQATCVFPGCRRPAAQCDADHTIPYDDGGKTCLCNLAPLCRHHHQVKQTPGWTLERTSPGTMTWTTPSGRRYTTGWCQ
jgi:hypothetical protein